MNTPKPCRHLFIFYNSEVQRQKNFHRGFHFLVCLHLIDFIIIDKTSSVDRAMPCLDLARSAPSCSTQLNLVYFECKLVWLRIAHCVKKKKNRNATGNYRFWFILLSIKFKAKKCLWRASLLQFVYILMGFMIIDFNFKQAENSDFFLPNFKVENNKLSTYFSPSERFCVPLCEGSLLLCKPTRALLSNYS